MMEGYIATVEAAKVESRDGMFQAFQVGGLYMLFQWLTTYLFGRHGTPQFLGVINL